MRHPILALATLASFLLLTLPAGRALADDDPSLAQAKAAYQAGSDAYLKGDYQTALQKFLEARQLRPAPLLDYNIGMTYEGLGDTPNALAYYQLYLQEDPNSQQHDQVAAHVAELEKQLQQSPQPAQAQPAQAQPTPTYQQPDQAPVYQGYTMPPPQPPAKKKKKSLWWIAPVVIGGVGLTALIVYLSVVTTPDTTTYYEQQPASLTASDPSAASNVQNAPALFRF